MDADGMRYKTEVQQLEAQGRGLSPLETSRSFLRSMWAQNAFSTLGIVATGASFVMTCLFAKQSLAAGAGIGSPALAFSAVTSGVIAALTAATAHFSQRYLQNRFNDKISMPLSRALAAPLVCDKMEWTAVLVANITMMNPVVVFRGWCSSITAIADSGNKFRLDYWKDIARAAASYAYSKRPTIIDPKLGDLQSFATAMKFNQKLNPPQPDSGAPGMSEFVGNLNKRWFGRTNEITGIAITAATISGLASAACIPTILAHSSKFGRYFEFLGDVASAGGRLLGF